MFKYLFTCWLFLTLSSPVKAGSATLSLQNDSLYTDNLIKAADSLTNQAGRFNTALKLFEEIFQISDIEKHPLYYSSLSNMAWCQWQTGQYNESIQSSNQVLSMDSSRINELYVAYSFALSSKAISYSFLGDFPKSIELFRQRIDLILRVAPEDHLRISVTYSNLATTYSRIGDVVNGLKFMKPALSYIAKAPASLQQKRQAGSIEQNLGWTYALLKNYRKSEEHFQNAIQHYQNIYSANHPSIGNLYIAMGGSYGENNKFELALDCLKEALAIFEENFGTGHFTIASALSDIGNAYTNLLQFDSASYFLSRSIAAAKRLIRDQSVDQSVLALPYFNMATMLSQTNDLKNAQHYLDSARRFMGRVDHRFNFELSIEQIDLYLRQSKMDKVIATLDSLRKASDQDHFDNSERSSIHAGYARYHRLNNRPDLALQSISEAIDQYRDGTGSLIAPNFDLLEYFLLQANLLIQDVNPTDKSTYSALKKCITEGLDIATQLLDYNSFQDKDGYISSFFREISELGFRAISLSRQSEENTDDEFASLLMDHSKSQRLKGLKHLLTTNHQGTDTLIAKLYDVKSWINYYQNQLLNAQENERNEFQQALINKQLELKLVLASIKESKRIHPNSPEANDDITAVFNHFAVEKGQLLLDYFYGENRIYILAMGKEGSSFFEVKNDNLLKSYLQEYSNELRDIQSHLEAGSYIYEKLLMPVLGERTDHINELVIIPDGLLWGLNFDLLLTNRVHEEDNRKLPYLLKRYNLRFAYSMSLFFNEKEQLTSGGQNLLAFSYGETDENYGDQVSLNQLRIGSDELPGSRSEIRAIAEFLDGDFYYGKYANEQQFKKVAPEYDILHLAIHGELNESDPESSFLSFYSSTDPSDDGRLHAFELYHMNLNADLAVLSACNTGAGQFVNGEGVLSLGSAFSYAGVNSLLLTRWDVTDATTPMIMKAFYREIKKGKKKSEALRIAKLEFLESANNITSDPYYWGVFFLVGNDSPIVKSFGYAYHFLFIAGAISIVLFLIYLKRIQK